VVVVLVACGLLLGAAPPTSATSCRFGDGVVHARVDGGTALRMFVWPTGSPEAGQIWWGNQSDSSQQGFCGRASVRNTDRVVVTGKGRTGRLDYQLPHRPFGPGRTGEATGVPEIEFVLRGGMTAFWMTGLGGIDNGEAETVHVGRRGVNVNGDDDLDVRFRSRVTNLYLFLLDGADVADGRGGHGTGAPWFRGRMLSVTGGDGDDVLHGHGGRDLLRGDGGSDWLHGYGGRDDLTDHHDDHLLGGAGDDVLTSTGGESWLLGGPGDDVLDALDLYVDVVLDGGPGDDSAWHDDEDVPVGIEHRLLR
jgi:Ca2+-binding RTX toxin-like protein